MRPLEHGPEGFHPVRLGLTADLIGDRVIDGLTGEVQRQSPVGGGIVRVDCRAGFGVRTDEALQGLAVHAERQEKLPEIQSCDG